MTKPAAQTISVGFISLGCAKNLVDSQVMAAEMIRGGLTLARSVEEADVVLVNTCAFIGDAREESLDAIREACELKAAGQCRAVIVTGCLPQRYRDRVVESMPEVDAFVGVDELDRIADVIHQVVRGEHGLLEVSRTSRRVFTSKLPGVVFTGGPFAYLKIAEGCNHRCGFCAIPGIRGAFRSRTTASLLDEAKILLGRGLRELNLISQDVTSYGRDFKDGTNLAGLVKALAQLDGRFWIRLLYGYPALVSDELLATMAAEPKVCHYLDIPIQHSHPAILRAMRRAETTGPVRDLAARVRGFMPDATLRTTCLVGFPGETEEQFEDLLAFIQATKFDHLGVFAYSPEEDTPAYDMTDCPPAEVAAERCERLLLAQQDVVTAKLAGLVGQETELLLEGRNGETGWVGRSPRFAPKVDGAVQVRGVPEGVHPGTFGRTRYVAVEEFDLVADWLGEA